MREGWRSWRPKLSRLRYGAEHPRREQTISNDWASTVANREPRKDQELASMVDGIMTLRLLFRMNVFTILIFGRRLGGLKLAEAVIGEA